MIDYKGLGKRVKELRLKIGKTQEQLSESVGISVNHVAHIECASAKLSLDVLIRLSNALQVTPDTLLSDSIHPSNESLKAEITMLLSSCSDNNLTLIREIVKTIKQVHND